MKSMLPTLAFVSALAGLAGAAEAAGGPLRVEHQPFACVLAGRHPLVEARLVGEVTRACVRFRGDAGTAYQVPMRAEGDGWVAVLPQPLASLARLSYRIEAYAVGGVATAPPGGEEFIADVVGEPCADGGRTAAVADAAEITLGVPQGRPRVPPGFGGAGVTAFLALHDRASVSGPAVPRAVAEGLEVGLGSRVRVVPRAEGQPSVVGHLVAIDDESVTVRRHGRGQEPLRFARADVERIDAYKGGHGGAKVVGGLAGMGAGLAASLLYYASNDDADSSAPLFVGVLGGLFVGIAAAPGVTWEPLDVWGVRVGLEPVPGGARVAARLRF